MEKFDKDTEAKQNELNALKAAKASDLAHLQDLAKMVRGGRVTLGSLGSQF